MKGLFLASLLMTSGSWDLLIEIVADDTFSGANESSLRLQGSIPVEQVASSTSTIEASGTQGVLHPATTFSGSILFSSGPIHLELPVGAVSGLVSTFDLVFSRVELEGLSGSPIGLVPLDGTSASTAIWGGHDVSGTWQFGETVIPFSFQSGGINFSTGSQGELVLNESRAPLGQGGETLGTFDAGGLHYRAAMGSVLTAVVHTPEPRTAVLLLLGLFLIASTRRHIR